MRSEPIQVVVAGKATLEEESSFAHRAQPSTFGAQMSTMTVPMPQKYCFS
jgi:hypothetical protein